MTVSRNSGPARVFIDTPASPSRRRWMKVAFLGGVLVFEAGRSASAAGYPSRSVRLVLGVASGGGPTDRIARLVALEFEKRWKVPVVVVNQGGASGTIGGRMVARGPADGYTLFVGGNGPIASAAVALSPETAGYDPIRDWAPVGRIARAGYVLIARSGLGVSTVREFALLAHARPEALSASSTGPASNSSLGLALFQQVAGVRIIEVPYKGGGDAIEAVVAGHVDAAFCDLALALPFAVSGAVRILAACSTHRLALAPDVPTFAEAGFPGVLTEAWYGIVAPAGTPRAVIAELVAALHAVLVDDDVRRRFTTMGYEAIVESPDQFADAIRLEMEQARAYAARASRQP
jgi:tripartite-type tricarboxylate transporter receptor subunit TctC